MVHCCLKPSSGARSTATLRTLGLCAAVGVVVLGFTRRSHFRREPINPTQRFLQRKMRYCAARDALHGLVPVVHLLPEHGAHRNAADVRSHMSIPTQMSLVGFVASAPELHFTKQGAECCRLRVGVEQWRRRSTASFTKLDPTFHDMVAFESTARETYARFRKGDSFVASGYIHEYEVESRDGASVIKEEFVASKIGHNANKTDYVVQRGRHAAAERPLTPFPSRRPSASDRRRRWTSTTSPTTATLRQRPADFSSGPPEAINWNVLDAESRRSSGTTSTSG